MFLYVSYKIYFIFCFFFFKFLANKNIKINALNDKTFQNLHSINNQKFFFILNKQYANQYQIILTNKQRKKRFWQFYNNFQKQRKRQKNKKFILNNK